MVKKKVTKKQIQDLSKFKKEFRTLARWLWNVKHRSGFFPIVQLKNMGMIKNFVKKKGTLVQGQMRGKKEYYVLTEKGKRQLNLLATLGY